MSLDPLAPLSGFTVGVTADRPAAVQIRALEDRGGRIVHGPTLQTKLASKRSTARLTARLVADPPHVAVFMTALGVHLWFEAAESAHLGAALGEMLQGVEVGARGPEAAAALLSVGRRADWIADPARSDEVLDRLERRGVEGSHVVVQVGGAGSDALPREISGLGARVTSVGLYRWTLPEHREPAQALVEAVLDRSVDAVTFTSRPALRNLLSIAAEMEVRDQVVAALRGDVVPVCLGRVCAAEANALGIDGVVVPVTADLQAMVGALADRFSERSGVFDLAGHRVRRQGCLVQIDDMPAVTMTARERQVFDLLSERPGVVVSKKELLRSIWPGSDSEHHIVEVTVSRLRRRFGDAGDCIETVIRRGYRLAAG
jgi:uroporphyrinogen-III synthase